jgi:hypothetical protein
LAALFVAAITVCGKGADAPDYQKVAETAKGDWPARNGDPFLCVGDGRQGYGLRMEVGGDRKSAVLFTITRSGKDVFSWVGHSHSVFAITNDTLFFADFSPRSEGGTIVAVDLGNGQVRWRSKLMAVGVVQHSGYVNWMTLDVDPNVVIIYGDETGGRYVEFKDRLSGRTVGHKTFPPPRPSSGL